MSAGRVGSLSRAMVIALVLAATLAGFVTIALAAPAHDAPFLLAQPDGTQFAARQFGDEWTNGLETLDGYTILKHAASGYWTYAEKSVAGALVPSGYVVGRDLPSVLPRRLRPAPATPRPSLLASGGVGVTPLQATGSRPMVAILVQFQDQPAQTTPATWQSRLFGATGSVKHYYGSASYGHFDVTPASESHGTANDGIVGWLTLPYDHPNFGSDFASGQRLAHDAMLAADPYVHFAAYDANGDGIVSADELLVVVIVAGNEAAFYDACAPNIWAHRWSVVPSVTVDDVQLAPYAMVGEMHCTASDPPGQPATVGVIVHEVGHLLGLPDLYDVDVSSEGVGNWGVMGGGTWNGTSRAGNSPSLMDPWSKYVLGWVTPTRVTSTLSHQAIPTAATDPTVFQFLAGSPTAGGEYFLVENRQRAGYDVGLPGTGLLVWHIDEAEPDNRRECGAVGTPVCSAGVHYKVAVVQADDLFGLEKKLNRGDGGDPFPGTSNRRAFTSATTPSSRRYSGAASGVSVTQISDSAATMTATLGIDGPAFSVSGMVTAGGVGLGNVTLTFTRALGTGALPAPVLTSAAGTWTQTGFDGGTTYRVTPSRTGVVFTPASSTFTAASSTLNFAVASTLTVTAPNGGETWGIDGLYTIRWSSVSLSSNVKIELSRDGGATWSTLAASVANTGSYAWTATGPATSLGQARVRVSSVRVAAVRDESNANFTVAVRSLTVTTPNGGQAWGIGTLQTIKWKSTAILGNVNVYLTRDASVTTPVWTLLFGNTANDGAQAWTVTGPLTTTATARIKVCSVVTPVVCDTSNSSFSIVGTVHVVAPNGGERWPIGAVRRITWASTPTSVPANVKIELSRDAGATWIVLAATTTNDTALDWTVTGPYTTQARIRVCGVSLPAICDTSNTNFTIGVADLIATSIRVTQPSLRGSPWKVESLSVKNAGTAPAVASVTYVYLVMNNIYYFMTSIGIPALTAGEVVDVHSAFITLPTSLPVGTYAIGIHLDVTEVVPETNENNWYFASGLSVFTPAAGGDTPVAPTTSAPMPLEQR